MPSFRKVSAVEAARWPAPHVGGGRAWTAAETDQLRALVDAGQSDRQIGRTLGRTPVAVHVRRTRLGISAKASPAVLSARDIADVLGLGCSKTVAHWISRGWLAAQKAGNARKVLWRVQWEDLTDFLEQPGSWMMWDPARVTDDGLRSWATELRQDQPRWLMPSEVARQCGVVRTIPNMWIHRGWLPAVRWANWWVWSDDLARFTLPSERKRTAPQPELVTSAPPLLSAKARWYQAIVAAYVAGESTYDIADVFGCTSGYVTILAKQAGVPLRGDRYGAAFYRKQAAIDAEIAWRYQAGESTRVIARDLGMRPEALYRRLHRVGVAANRIHASGGE